LRIFDDGVEAGIVDVPGHERFLHNMLAGAAGMEILLLVVAANEGPRPQTLEHLAILTYLNVRKTLLVLTKRDLVDADELGFAEELTREALRGTVAEGAAAYAVSTLTGEGMDELRSAIHDALVALPARKPDAPAFLPIDRVFALAGHGTIVTGTLMQGTLCVGDTLRLQPSGRDVRVRSLHVFGQKQQEVRGGSRVAANLPQIDTREIERGEVLASPEFSVLRQFEVTFTPLETALPLLRRRNHVRAYLGSAEILGTLSFEETPLEAKPVSGILSLRRAAAMYPGEAFVVRRKTCSGAGLPVPALPLRKPMGTVRSTLRSRMFLLCFRRSGFPRVSRPRLRRAQICAKSARLRFSRLSSNVVLRASSQSRLHSSMAPRPTTSTQGR